MKDKADVTREGVIAVISKTAAELVLEKIQCEKFKKQNSELTRETDILDKDLQNSEDRSGKLVTVIRLQHNTAKNLQVEESGHVVHGRQQHDQIESLEADLEKYERAQSEGSLIVFFFFLIIFLSWCFFAHSFLFFLFLSLSLSLSLSLFFSFFLFLSLSFLFSFVCNSQPTKCTTQH
jgi:hypothetical protein